MPSRVSFGFPLNVAVKSDVGRVRSNNEDAFGVRWLDDGSLFVIVADGMGGHEAGEVASGLAVRVLEESVTRDPDADPRERMYNGLLEANTSIIEEGRASGTRGMGTTAVVGVFRGAEVHVGLVGDSRLYHFRRGQLIWRTLDHTRVQMLIDQGEISDEQARAHPESGMLTRALGHARMADGRPLTPDVLAEPLYLEQEDLLVLCSDGLHDLMEDWEIGQVASGLDPEEACDRLIAQALDRGGHDNVTVAVITAGDTSAPYDHGFVPDNHYSVEEAPPDVEATFDVFPDGSQAPAGAPPQIAHHGAVAAPAEKGNNAMMVGMVAAVVLAVVVGGMVLLAVAAAAFYVFV